MPKDPRALDLFAGVMLEALEEAFADWLSDLPEGPALGVPTAPPIPS